MISIRNISHAFGTARVLDGISLDLKPGGYTVLLGPSGSGKTTLLSILGGFLTPSSGEVLINGADYTRVPPARRPTATVFQDYALFPHMSVIDNVGFGLLMRGMKKPARRVKAQEALTMVGLPDAGARKPHELSGGQRQRVALARALVVEPQLLLLDEPLGALDLKLRRQMQDELKALQRRVGLTFVHVTHDQEEAMALADHLVVMNHGRVEDQGSPEKVYSRPATRFAATFMGESTIIGQRAIRPEHITLVKGESNLGQAQVTDVVYQGSFKRVTARRGEAVFLARLPADTPVKEGDEVLLACETRHMIELRD